jgi:hypothetical protein
MTATIRLLIVVVLTTLCCSVSYGNPLPAQSGIVNKTNSYTAASPVRPPQGVVSDGKITNVILNPQDTWLTGTTVQISWVWPGYVGKPC